MNYVKVDSKELQEICEFIFNEVEEQLLIFNEIELEEQLIKRPKKKIKENFRFRFWCGKEVLPIEKVGLFIDSKDVCELRKIYEMTFFADHVFMSEKCIWNLHLYKWKCFLGGGNLKDSFGIYRSTEGRSDE